MIEFESNFSVYRYFNLQTDIFFLKHLNNRLKDLLNFYYFNFEPYQILIYKKLR